MQISIGSDVVVKISDVEDGLTGLPVANATGTVALLDNLSDPPLGSYAIQGTASPYYAVIPASLTAGLSAKNYTLRITLQGQGRTNVWEDSVPARKAGF